MMFLTIPGLHALRQRRKHCLQRMNTRFSNAAIKRGNSKSEARADEGLDRCCCCLLVVVGRDKDWGPRLTYKDFACVVV